MSLSEVFVGVQDPCQSGKVEHNLVELLVVAVSAVLSGADTFVEIEEWATEKLPWLREHLELAHGIASHDTFARVFALIDPQQFEAAFRRWVASALPVPGGQVVAIDGKTSRRSGKADAAPLHLVSAFAAGANLVLGQRATEAKSSEKTAIPELLASLSLQGCIVTIDAMGTQANIAQAIRDRGAHYVLAVKDNQPLLADSIRDFYALFKQAPRARRTRYPKPWARITGAWRRAVATPSMPCSACIEANSGRIWPRLQWSNPNGGYRARAALSCACTSAACPLRLSLASVIRQHWSVENNLHWCMVNCPGNRGGSNP